MQLPRLLWGCGLPRHVTAAAYSKPNREKQETETGLQAEVEMWTVTQRWPEVNSLVNSTLTSSFSKTLLLPGAELFHGVLTADTQQWRLRGGSDGDVERGGRSWAETSNSKSGGEGGSGRRLTPLSGGSRGRAPGGCGWLTMLGEHKGHGGSRNSNTRSGTTLPHTVQPGTSSARHGCCWHAPAEAGGAGRGVSASLCGGGRRAKTTKTTDRNPGVGRRHRTASWTEALPTYFHIAL